MKHLIVLLFPLTLFAETKFVWVQKDPSKIETGVCLEVDAKLDVSNFYKAERFDYAKKISSKKCKPDDKEISYIFNPRLGRCFEGDSKTNGKKYFLFTDIKKMQNR